MNRFSQKVSELKEWPQYCLRNEWSQVGDGLGCSVKSYHNLTSYLDIVSMKDQTQAEIDAAILNIAPIVMADDNIRKTLQKNFSE